MGGCIHGNGILYICKMGSAGLTGEAQRLDFPSRRSLGPCPSRNANLPRCVKHPFGLAPHGVTCNSPLSLLVPVAHYKSQQQQHMEVFFLGTVVSRFASRSLVCEKQ